MALTVNNSFVHAQNFIKANSTYASTDEVRIANTINSLIVGFHRWHWSETEGVGRTTVAGTQDYTMDAADQNAVLAITQANLLTGTTELPELQVWSDPPLPRTDTQRRPFACGLISPTEVRLYWNPDAVYTFQWRYYARPTIFTANSENWDIPEAFTEVVKTGMIWQLLAWSDDERQDTYKQDFFNQLANHRRIEFMTVGRSRV